MLAKAGFQNYLNCHVSATSLEMKNRKTFSLEINGKLFVSLENIIGDDVEKVR